VSCDYYVYCLRCKSRHDTGVNHGDEQMLAWVRHASAIAALLPLMREPHAGLELKTYQQWVDVCWFAEHASHELAVIDEYDRLLDQCTDRVVCTGCQRQFNCFRTLQHEGACSPREADRGT
jgi:hypothetical protein